MKTTAILFAGALLFTGCASNGGNDGGSTAAADECETVRVAVRDISNGAQNAVITGTEQAAVLEKLDGYEQRLDDLATEYADDEDISAAIATLQEKVTAAEDYAKTLPTAPDENFEADADAQAAVTGDIQAASITVTQACEGE
ncbi:hypothetical protein PX701_09035 [Agromyces sp. H3Y2-19a]|uniref:hypothetical protein n=1 Tax=Agromyces TaxID=33877 RepID=UPI001E50EAC3|nr:MULTISPECIES: hypothetical protein [Agromyces]MCD5345078.1 hypothetical protein [Agromyces sp. S2-1-8]MDF0513764.1 hypothetical protein [Agromyces chromiiresistens]